MRRLVEQDEMKTSGSAVNDIILDALASRRPGIPKIGDDVEDRISEGK
jgi:hypothetical protein